MVLILEIYILVETRGRIENTFSSNKDKYDQGCQKHLEPTGEKSNHKIRPGLTSTLSEDIVR